MTIKRLHVGPRLSEAAVFNGVIYMPTGDDVAPCTPSQDIGGQTQQVLAAIDRLLGEADSDKTRILQATIFLKTMADFPAMNAAQPSR